MTMNIAALDNQTALTASAGVAGGAASRADFATALHSAGRDRQQVREAAEQFVSTAFLMPLLEQARQDPFKSDLFHGGQGEEMFGQQLDQHYADTMVRGIDFPLVDAIERFVMNNATKRSMAAAGGQVNTHA